MRVLEDKYLTVFMTQVKNLFDKKYLQSFSDGWADDIDEWYPGETRFRGSSVYNRPQEITLRIRKDF